MARRYVRDAKGRFASKGYTGQTGGRGARLKSAGKTRAGGGKRENLIGANDQSMTSLPKGTIGKTAKLRRRSTMDMTGQQFAKYEAGKKAAKSEISRKKQEAFFDAKAGIKPDIPKGSYAAVKVEQAKGRVKQFTTAKKSVDAEIRQVRQQIKDARSNAMTFGDVPALKLKLLNLQGKSKEYKATIDRAKQQAKGE